MSNDASKRELKEPALVKNRTVSLEHDMLRKIHSATPHILQALSQGTLLRSLFNRAEANLKALLPHSYCLFITCDKHCANWYLPQQDATNRALLNRHGRLTSIPQAVITFAASLSCPMRYFEGIRQASDWNVWSPFFADNAFEEVAMTSAVDHHGTVYIALVFQKQAHRLEESLIELALCHHTALIRAIFEREKADFLLLEENYRDPSTGLLRRHSFDNSFNIVLKDSRRQFQRAAVFSIRLLSSSKVDEGELKTLVDVIRDTVRDNDLVARYDEHELVMGIRIQHYSDAEVVAEKILASLNLAKFQKNTLINGGVAIGIAFYPEHSSLRSLHQAALLASGVLGRHSGYRLEFHGEYHETSAAFYSI